MEPLKHVKAEDRAGIRILLTQEATTARMSRQGAISGFAPVPSQIEDYWVLNLGWGRGVGLAYGVPYLIEVISGSAPNRFLSALTSGFALAKAWGCSLTLLRGLRRTCLVRLPGLPLSRPIPLKEGTSMMFIERSQINVRDGAVVDVGAAGMRTPVRRRRYCLSDTGNLRWRLSRCHSARLPDRIRDQT